MSLDHTTLTSNQPDPVRQSVEVSPYVAPQVTVLGRITDLTQANSPGPKIDGNTRRKK